MIVLGVGVEPGVAAAHLAAAVEALGLEALGLGPVEVVATIDTRSAEPAVLAVADGRELRVYPASVLATVEVPHPSPVVRRRVGTGSVAEAAALLAAREQDPGARLVVGKRRGDGVTVAVAHGDPDGDAATPVASPDPGPSGGPHWSP